MKFPPINTLATSSVVHITGVAGRRMVVEMVCLVASAKGLAGH